MTAEAIRATRYRSTYFTTRYEQTTTVGTNPPETITNDGPLIGPVDRRNWKDGTNPLSGEAWNYKQAGTGYNLGTKTTTVYFRMVGRVIPVSFEVIFQITMYNATTPPDVSLSSPVTFSIPDGAQEYAFTVPVPSTNQYVGIHSVTTKFPA